MESDKYITYLLGDAKYSSCVKGGKVLEISHDMVNRFLLSGNFTGKDLFDKAIVHLDLVGGTLSVDDSVLDKPYSDISKNDLVGYFYSGKHHKAVKGINLITLLYTDSKDISLPVNFRIYDKKDCKTKNEYFRDMVNEVLKWGLKPNIVTGDAWYSSIANFKFLRKNELSFLFGIAINRVISSDKGIYREVGQVEIPENGLYTHLKEFDFVKIFKTVDKENNVRYYALEKTLGINTRNFYKAHYEHWKIEIFHRISKQSCNIEDFFVRKGCSVRTHIFCALRAFIRLSAWVRDHLFETFYSVHRQIFLNAQHDFIRDFA